MIITIGVEKGGTGKSTTATNLACYLAIKNEEVAIIDGDIQKTASYWMAVRENYRLKDNNIAVLLISHRMPDIFEVCDKLVVLRRGEKVCDKLIKDSSTEEATGLITGAIDKIQ